MGVGVEVVRTEAAGTVPRAGRVGVWIPVWREAAWTPGRAGHLGRFASDIQVFAHIISNKDIRERFWRLQSDLDQDNTLRVDGSALRLLDAALWTYAKENGVAASPGAGGSTEGAAVGFGS